MHGRTSRSGRRGRARPSTGGRFAKCARQLVRAMGRHAHDPSLPRLLIWWCPRLLHDRRTRVATVCSLKGVVLSGVMLC